MARLTCDRTFERQARLTCDSSRGVSRAATVICDWWQCDISHQLAGVQLTVTEHGTPVVSLRSTNEPRAVAQAHVQQASVTERAAASVSYSAGRVLAE